MKRRINNNQEPLQTPTLSISNDDSNSRAPPHKNTVQVGATVEPTSKKPKASEDANRGSAKEVSQKIEDEDMKGLNREEIIALFSVTPMPKNAAEFKKMEKEVYEEDWC